MKFAVARAGPGHGAILFDAPDLNARVLARTVPLVAVPHRRYFDSVVHLGKA